MKTEETWELAARVLGNRPAALVSDIDGTVSPIAPSPAEAYVLPECRAALEMLASRLELVAVVSGRSAEQARRMVGLDELLYVGNHGLEQWDRARGYRNIATTYESEAKRIFQRLQGEVESIQGTRLENKETVIAIHYRASAQPNDARRQILDAAARVLTGTTFRASEGKKVVELRPPILVDKGSVVANLIEEHRLKTIVFIGDDLTDVDALRKIKELRRRGKVTGLSLGVSGDDTPAELTAEADALLPGPSAVAAFLLSLSKALLPNTD
ncbi:MAG: trehalose-phosphatase [Dehalococcoidia bacterium]|jgi:trehalose 6-phosphate phosphatase